MQVLHVSDVTCMYHHLLDAELSSDVEDKYQAAEVTENTRKRKTKSSDECLQSKYGNFCY